MSGDLAAAAAALVFVMAGVVEVRYLWRASLAALWCVPLCLGAAALMAWACVLWHWA